MGSSWRPPPVGDTAPPPPLGWLVVHSRNQPPELIQLVIIWGPTPRWWRVSRMHRFSHDADGGAYLLPMWEDDEFGMQRIVRMVLIWNTVSSGPSCPPYVCVCVCIVCKCKHRCMHLQLRDVLRRVC